MLKIIQKRVSFYQTSILRMRLARVVNKLKRKKHFMVIFRQKNKKPLRNVQSTLLNEVFRTEKNEQNSTEKCRRDKLLYGAPAHTEGRQLVLHPCAAVAYLVFKFTFFLRKTENIR